MQNSKPENGPQQTIKRKKTETIYSNRQKGFRIVNCLAGGSKMKGAVVG